MNKGTGTQRRASRASGTILPAPERASTIPGTFVRAILVLGFRLLIVFDSR